MTADQIAAYRDAAYAYWLYDQEAEFAAGTKSDRYPAEQQRLAALLADADRLYELAEIGLVAYRDGWHAGKDQLEQLSGGEWVTGSEAAYRAGSAAYKKGYLAAVGGGDVARQVLSDLLDG